MILLSGGVMRVLRVPREWRQKPACIKWNVEINVPKVLGWLWAELGDSETPSPAPTTTLCVVQSPSGKLSHRGTAGGQGKKHSHPFTPLSRAEALQAAFASASHSEPLPRGPLRACVCACV